MAQVKQNRNFRKDLKQGEDQEKLIIRLYKERYLTDLYKVDNITWRKADIDLINKQTYIDSNFTESIKDKVKTIEVKTDDTVTKNLAIETWSDIEKNKKGWGAICQAEIIYIVRPNMNRIYAIHARRLKDYMKNNYDSLYKLRNSTTDDKGYTYFSEFALLNIEKAQKANLVLAIYTIDTFDYIHATKQYFNYCVSEDTRYAN